MAQSAGLQVVSVADEVTTGWNRNTACKPQLYSNNLLPLVPLVVIADGRG